MINISQIVQCEVLHPVSTRLLFAYHSMSYFFSFGDTSVEKTYISGENIHLVPQDDSGFIYSGNPILNVAQRLQRKFNSVESDSVHVYGHVVLSNQPPGMGPAWSESSCRLCGPR